MTKKPETKLALAIATAKYWHDNATNLQIREFAKCFLMACEGHTHLVGIPSSELAPRVYAAMMEVRMDRDAEAASNGHPAPPEG